MPAYTVNADTMPVAVHAVIDNYPEPARTGVLRLRELILEVAAGLLMADVLEETLKWGQPAYLAPKGSTLRIGLHKEASFALFAHCQSRIISDYAQTFPGWDRLDGNRAVLFETPGQIEPNRLSHLIQHALTYHRKR